MSKGLCVEQLLNFFQIHCVKYINQNFMTPQQLQHVKQNEERNKKSHNSKYNDTYNLHAE